MKIYDISQEVFSCEVYKGDPSPKKETVSSMENGALYNLTAFSMCAHNGTHIDAPLHFYKNGGGVESIPLYKTVGWAYVAEHSGEVSAADAEGILSAAKALMPDAALRILIKGCATVTLEGAEVFKNAGVFLLANESQTVGPEEAPMAVHLSLLGAETVLLEGVRLNEVKEGVYFLCAAPLCLSGCDGAPVRAVLIAGFEENHE